MHVYCISLLSLVLLEVFFSFSFFFLKQSINKSFTAIWPQWIYFQQKNKTIAGYEKLLTPALTPFNNTASLSMKYSRRSAGYWRASLWPVNWCVSEINVSISPSGYSLKIQVPTSLSVSACADECCKERHLYGLSTFYVYLLMLLIINSVHVDVH